MRKAVHESTVLSLSSYRPTDPIKLRGAKATNAFAASLVDADFDSQAINTVWCFFVCITFSRATPSSYRLFPHAPHRASRPRAGCQARFWLAAAHAATPIRPDRDKERGRAARPKTARAESFLPNPATGR